MDDLVGILLPSGSYTKTPSLQQALAVALFSIIQNFNDEVYRAELPMPTWMDG